MPDRFRDEGKEVDEARGHAHDSGHEAREVEEVLPNRMASSTRTAKTMMVASHAHEPNTTPKTAFTASRTNVATGSLRICPPSQLCLGC